MSARRTPRRIDSGLASRLGAALNLAKPVAPVTTSEPTAREIVAAFHDQIRALRSGNAPGELGANLSWNDISQRLRMGGSTSGADALRKAYAQVEEEGKRRRKRAQSRKTGSTATPAARSDTSALPSRAPAAAPPLNRFRLDRDDLQNIDCQD